MVRSFLALVLFAFGGLTLIAALFVIITTYFGAAVGFFSVSSIFFLSGLLLAMRVKKQTGVTSGRVAAVQTSDPLASLIPAQLIEDPSVARLVKQISENPITTTAAAAGIAMLLTREFMGD